MAASTPRPTVYWEELAESRSKLFENNTNLAGEIIIFANDNSVIYQSLNWQETFNNKLIFPPQPPPPEGSIENLEPFPFRPQNPGTRPTDKPFNAQPSQTRQNFLPPAITTELSSLMTLKSPSHTWRVGTVSSPFVRMAIAVDLESFHQEMAAIRNIFLILTPMTLSLVMAGAWWLSGDALKSLNHIINTIKKVTAKDLNQRVSIDNLDLEFIELVQVFNQMMERLERSFQQASRFSADAAHELKTPLAILQGELERSLQKTKLGSELQQTFSHLLDEVCRLNSITRKLLLLSLADAGKMNLKKDKFNLAKLIIELAEDIDLIAPELDINIDITTPLDILGDQDLINQVLQNLITNAIKYNIEHGWIHITGKQDKNMVFIRIANASKELSPGDRQHIFDRFSRGDTSRNRNIEGFGLGLNLSREIIRAHGGNLYLEQATPGNTAFILSLPLKSPH